MALVLKDRVQESATANTTVSFTLNGATTGYQSFAAIGNTNTVYYGASDGTNWEVGIGTYSTSGPTLTRTTILSSSNSGSAVTFSGTVIVFCDYPAGQAVYEDAAGAVTGYTISGGTIDNTVIGGTTPVAGTFTTITGQTEVLKGTGQNFLLQSQTFDSGSWPKNISFITADQVAAPDGTTTADYFYATNPSSAFPSISQAFNCTTNQTYTFSVYVRSAEKTTASIQVFGNSTTFISGADAAGLTSTWTRVTVTVNSASYTSLQFRILFSGSAVTWTGSQGIYIWGAQAELASTAGTYLATTTTAVYGTPTLSFSGVAGLGLQSDGSLYVSPAGTGAIQAQATTSSATGGNARGANSVDWQTLRNLASQVASGTASVIGGGYQNTSSGNYNTISGGQGNIANSSYGGVGSGASNTLAANYSFIGGGTSNSITNGVASNYSFIGSGVSNSAHGVYNFVGGGFTNSGTSASAVTTQSATMNATTAVTLAASNANIKVGQYITGTSIASDTYVAAISGTSLTLSKNASGSSTSTLSFYTPHGVVVGGGNNQATGSYSFIGGGGDAGTAANRNVASGDWSFVGGGAKNVASGTGAFVGGGGPDGGGNFYANTSSGASSAIVGGVANVSSGLVSFVGGGASHSASGSYSTVGGGNNNFANANYSFISGGSYGTTRAIIGNNAIAACNVPIAGSLGVSQAALLILARQTTDATATVLTSTTGAAGTTNQVILPNNSAYYFKGSVISNVTGAANGAAWSFEGAIMRGANAASTVFIGTPAVNRTASTTGASAWSIALTTDTTNGGLAITVTGAASTTIRWVAKVETTEVTY
jgi:hypothetical protein